jgi:hypothetical protein
MSRTVEISKRAFIARLNQQARRVVVDTFYKVIDGEQKLILKYNDGSQEIFKGLRSA